MRVNTYNVVKDLNQKANLWAGFAIVLLFINVGQYVLYDITVRSCL